MWLKSLLITGLILMSAEFGHGAEMQAQLGRFIAPTSLKCFGYDFGTDPQGTLRSEFDYCWAVVVTGLVGTIVAMAWISTADLEGGYGYGGDYYGPYGGGGVDYLESGLDYLRKGFKEDGYIALRFLERLEEEAKYSPINKLTGGYKGPRPTSYTPTTSYSSSKPSLPAKTYTKPKRLAAKPALPTKKLPLIKHRPKPQLKKLISKPKKRLVSSKRPPATRAKRLPRPSPRRPLPKKKPPPQRRRQRPAPRPKVRPLPPRSKRRKLPPRPRMRPQVNPYRRNKNNYFGRKKPRGFAARPRPKQRQSQKRPPPPRSRKSRPSRRKPVFSIG